jgi:hypothetical protein
MIYDLPGSRLKKVFLASLSRPALRAAIVERVFARGAGRIGPGFYCFV